MCCLLRLIETELNGSLPVSPMQEGGGYNKTRDKGTKVCAPPPKKNF